MFRPLCVKRVTSPIPAMSYGPSASIFHTLENLSVWMEQTGAIGLYVKRGKYGGTYAHKDVAFELASAISPTKDKG